MSDDDKPFACRELGCGMRFTNEDHLNVHMRKHEMTLALNLGSSTSSPSHPFLDQTPTPTKFLRNCEEIGLFNELNKNPFEEAFKKASDTDVVPLPGPHSNDLNTPVPPDRLELGSREAQVRTQERESVIVVEGGVLDLSGRRPSARVPAPLPSSTTGDDDVTTVTSQAADSTGSPIKSTVTSPVLEPVISQSTVTMAPTPISSAVALGNAGVASAPQYTMQVFLQLPSGEAVPVQLPASLGAITTVPMATTPAVSLQTSTFTPTSSGSSLSLKQRLKQTLQAQQQQQQQQLQQQQLASPVSSFDSNSHLLLSASSPPQGNTPILINHPLSVGSSDDSPSDSMDYDMSSGKRIKRSSDDDPDERRRKFLERNRAAAARCRQKRKQWIINLEKKADDLQNTNSRLQSLHMMPLQTEVNQLRGEVAHLKALLLTHKDCPITQQQKSQSHIASFSLVSGAGANLTSLPSSFSISLPSVVTSDPNNSTFTLVADSVLRIKEEKE